MKDSESNTAATTGRSALSVVSSIHQGARDYQEDSLGHWFDPQHKRLFAVVADGAGGHGGGAEASQAAIESSAKTWKESSSDAFPDPEAFLTEWMKLAHLAVNEAAAKIHRSARSVVVACLADGESVHWVHAGDSRLLRFHEGKLVERTRDDSVVQVLFERGEITEEQMGTHPDQSRLLQSLGGEDPPSPRLGNADLEAGDALILCSDGFWEHLKRDELEELTATPSKRRQTALDQAVATAVKRGGAKADNTTAIMIHCGDTQSASSGRFLLWLLLAAAFGSLAAWLLIEYKPWPGHSARSPQTKPVNPLTAEPTKAPQPSPPVSTKPQPSAADSEDKPASETPAPPWPGHPARSPSHTAPEQPTPSPEPAPPIPEP